MPKKILFLSHDSSLQGAERCLIDLVSNLDRSRFEPLVVLPWRGPMESYLEQANIPYTVRYFTRWIPSRRHGTWRYPFIYLKALKARLWSIHHLIEREGIDLVYTNTSTILEGALAAHKAGIPHIWHIHEYLDGNPDLTSYLPNMLIDKIIVSLSESIITPSKILSKKRFHLTKKAHTVSNAVNVDIFKNGNSYPIKEEFNLTSDTPVVTFIGAIAERKDPLVFILAAEKILKSKPNTQFLIIGDGHDEPLNNTVKKLIHDKKLSASLHLLGFRNDTHDLLAATTVHVSTSKQETFGLTIAEAMVCCRPVVATRCGGPEEVIIDNKTGLIVDVGDYNAVAAAVLYLLDNPLKAAAMGKAGKERVMKYFSIQRYINQISNIIENSCHEHT
ncbi:MAG: glycosyltransferase family 4 protein [Candidatus Reddybacter sp.]